MASSYFQLYRYGTGHPQKGRRHTFLSYSTVLLVPTCQRSFPDNRPPDVGPRIGCAYPDGWMVENNGFEPLTPCLQSRCSSQLS